MFKITKYLSLFLTLLLLVTSFTFGISTQTSLSALAPYEEGVLLVQYERNLPEQAKAAIREANGLKLDKLLNRSGLERVFINDNRPLHSVLNQLAGMAGISFAEPDYILYASPGDTQIIDSSFVNPVDEAYYNLLWGLNNTGQAIRNIAGDGSTDIDAPAAWEMTGGSNTIIVAVIDEAVDMTHPDLQGVVIDFQKFNTGATAYNHGTHVAGTIAAVDNAIGVVGVAPNVKIMSLSFLGTNGGSTSNAILAINYAKEHGAHIINASWGGGGYSQALKDAIENFGGPFVAASGNDGVNTDGAPHYPSSYTSSNIISVAAVSNKGELASFSNYGVNSVDIAAPGVDIVSTYPGSYAYMSGTSMATPHVAGVVALMKSYKPDATTNELIQALYASGRVLSSLSGKVGTGKMVDADNALIALGGASNDTIPPTLVSTLPSDQTSQVSINTPLKLVFDEPVKLIGSNITLNGTLINAQASGNEILLIPPVSPLSYDTVYTVSVAADAVADLSDNAYGTPISFSFMTESAPTQQFITVLSSTPTNNQTNIKRTANIVFTFDAVFTSIDSTKIILKDNGGNPVSFTLSGLNTNKLTINPGPTLSSLTKYTIILSEGAVSSSTATLSPYTLSFTTGKK